MVIATLKFYSSEHLQVNDLEEKVEKKMNDVNSFLNSIRNMKEINTYFKQKDHKPKKKYKNDETFNPLLESIVTAVNIGATTISVT